MFSSPHHRPHLNRRHPNRPPALRLRQKLGVSGDQQAGGLAASVHIGLKTVQNAAVSPVAALPARKPHPQVVGFAPVLVIGAVEPNVGLQQRVQRGQGFTRSISRARAWAVGLMLPGFEGRGDVLGLNLTEVVFFEDHAVLKALAASLWGCSFTQ